MSRDEKSSQGPRYTVGTGNIITGRAKIRDTQMINVGGSRDNEQPQWLPQLRGELARIRLVLVEGGDPAVSADDLDGAVEAVRALENDVADAQDSGRAGTKRFRRRIRTLIETLAPLSEIIGGVAALEAILKHLLAPGGRAARRCMRSIPVPSTPSQPVISTSSGGRG